MSKDNQIGFIMGAGIMTALSIALYLGELIWMH